MCCSSQPGTTQLLMHRCSCIHCWSSTSAIFAWLAIACRRPGGRIFCGRLSAASCCAISGYRIFCHRRRWKLLSRFCLSCGRICWSGALIRVLSRLGLAHRIRRCCFMLSSCCSTGLAPCFWSWVFHCLKTGSMLRFPFIVRLSLTCNCLHGSTRISWITPIMIFLLNVLLFSILLDLLESITESPASLWVRFVVSLGILLRELQPLINWITMDWQLAIVLDQ